jgi:hypothetical protein
MEHIEWPHSIRINGLPLLLSGWNSVLYRTNETSDGAPIYRLDAYTLYFFFPIIGIELKRVDGKWGLYRDCDGPFLPLFLKQQGNPKDLFGNWNNYDMHVSHHFPPS